MSIKIKTLKLQEMVSRAVKGAGANKLLPITQMMDVKLEKKKLTLETTDGANYLYISESPVDGDDFRCVVPVEIFSKLVSKLTCEFTVLDLADSILTVTGNGTYKIELPLDEDGSNVKYPDPMAKTKLQGTPAQVDTKTLKSIYNVCSAAVATTLEEPCYTGYYFGENVVATDTTRICGVEGNVFKQDPALISPEMMQLVDTFNEDKVSVYIKDGTVVMKAETSLVYGPLMEGIEDYQIEDISSLLYNTSYPGTSKVKKDEFLAVLDRIALFVGEYENNAVRLTFTDKGLGVQSIKENSSELIPSTDVQGDEFTCLVDVLMLTAQIKAQTGNTVEFQYGEPNAIKMLNGNVTQVLSLMQEEG